MDGHTDSPGSPDTPLPSWLKLCAPSFIILLAGLIITALTADSIAQHASEQSGKLFQVRWVWIAGLATAGIGAVMCGVVAIRWQHQARLTDAQKQKHEAHDQELSNVQTEKRILRQALNDSEQRSRDLVSLSGGIVCELDEHGKAGYVSAQVADMLGFAPADLAGINLDTLIAESDQNGFKATLEAARQDRQMQRMELSLVAASQQSLPAILRVLALHDTLHGFSGFRLILQPRNIAQSASDSQDWRDQ